MDFINPLALLEVSSTDIELIKKAKRKKNVEFDLNADEMIDYQQRKINKSDFIRVTDELDDPKKVENYLALLPETELELFLGSGDTRFFETKNVFRVLENKELTAFVSPYFSEKYNTILAKAYQNQDLGLLQELTRNPLPISPEDEDRAYEATSILLRDGISDLEAMCKKVKEGEALPESFFDDKSLSLNTLPAYFQTLRNDYAMALRDIAIALHNEKDDVNGSFAAIAMAQNLTTNFGIEEKIKEDYAELNRRNTEYTFKKTNAQEFEAYDSVLATITEITRKLEAKKIDAANAWYGIDALFSVEELNELPEEFEQLRNQFALVLKDFAVAAWNADRNIIASSEALDCASELKVAAGIKMIVNDNYIEIGKLRAKYGAILLCHFCETNSPDDKCGKLQTVYQVTSRGFRSVNYQYSSITIPRCKSCDSAHSSGSLYYWMCIIIGIVIGIAGNSLFGNFFVSLILFGGLGWLAGYLLKSNKYETLGIKGTSDEDVRSFPPISDRLREGWTLTQPSA